MYNDWINSKYLYGEYYEKKKKKTKRMSIQLSFSSLCDLVFLINNLLLS